jgi:hypothetical protein
MPRSWQDSPIQRKRCKSGTLDARAQPHRRRAGLLDREVSALLRHSHTHPPGTRPRIQPNQGCSSQPGHDWLGRVSTRQSIRCNSQNSGDPLQTIIMTNDQQRLDEALHRQAPANITFSVALPQFHPAQQIEGLLVPTTPKGSLKGSRLPHGHKSRRHPAGKSVPTRIGLHSSLQFLIQETVLLGFSNESHPTSGALRQP